MTDEFDMDRFGMLVDAVRNTGSLVALAKLKYLLRNTEPRGYKKEYDTLNDAVSERGAFLVDEMKKILEDITGIDRNEYLISVSMSYIQVGLRQQPSEYGVDEETVTRQIREYIDSYIETPFVTNIN